MKRWVIGAGVVLLLSLAWVVVDRATEGRVKRAVEEKAYRGLLGVPEPKQYVSWPGVTIRPGKEWLRKMAKAPLTSGIYEASCIVKWKVPAGTDQGELANFTVNIGAMVVDIIYVSSSGGNHTWNITISLPSGPESFTYTVQEPEEGQPPVIAEMAMSIRMDEAGLLETVSSSPIGDKAATHAKEMIVSEEWYAITSGITAIVGGHSYIDSYTGVMSLSMGFGTLTADPDHIAEVGKYAYWIEDIRFCGEVVDLSAFTPRNWGGESDLWVEGTSTGTIGLWGETNKPYGYYDWDGGSINAPRHYTFSGEHDNMDGVAIDDQEVYCTGLRNIDTVNHLDLGPLKKTWGELKAGEFRQKYGFHSWDENPADVVSPVILYKDKASAQAHKLEGFGQKKAWRVEGAGKEDMNGDYWEEGTWQAIVCYTNGYGWLYKYGEEWQIFTGCGPVCYYRQVEGAETPEGAYELGDFEDHIDEETGEWVNGIGPPPAVSEATGGTNVDVSELSFGHDARMIIDFHTLKATDRTSSPYVNDITALTHFENVGVYGSCLAHGDWKNVSNCTTPDSGGNFTVDAADGQLKLILPYGYISRNYAVGMTNAVPVPDAYWYFDYDHHLDNGYIVWGAGLSDYDGWYFDSGTDYGGKNVYINHNSKRIWWSGTGWRMGPTAGGDYYYQNDPSEQPMGQYTAGNLEGGGDPPKCSKNEAVGCWRGWGYWYMTFTSPEETTVKATITYYDDLVVTDNHFSDSSRQTEYSFSPGVAKTVTMESTIGAGANQTVCFDLFTLRPKIVTQIVLEFGAAGSWKVSEPLLSVDIGDNQTGRAATTTHGAHKEFDAYTYSEGGMSGHYDGMFLEALEIPDHYKPNRFEKTLGRLNVVIGKNSGLDLTTVLSAAAYIGMARSSGDSWDGTYSTTKEEEAFKDEDDVWLKVPTANDFRQVILSTSDVDGDGKLPMACRVGEVNTEKGIKYTFYVTDFNHSQFHGNCETETGSRVRVRNGDNITKGWRRILDTSDDWELAEDNIDSDKHGHFHSQALEVVKEYTNNNPTLWEYAAALLSADITTDSRLAAREFIAFVATGGLGGDIMVVEHVPGIIYIFYCVKDSNQIQHIYTAPPDMYYDTGISQAGYSLPHLDVTPTDGSPSGYVDKRGILHLFHVYQNKLHHLTSENFGNTWSADAIVIAGENISRWFTLARAHEGLQFGFAVDTSGAFKMYLSKDNFTDAVWTTDVNRFTIATGLDSSAQPSAYRDQNGRLMAYAVLNNATVCYRSNVTGKEWALVTA